VNIFIGIVNAGRMRKTKSRERVRHPTTTSTPSLLAVLLRWYHPFDANVLEKIISRRCATRRWFTNEADHVKRLIALLRIWLSIIAFASVANASIGQNAGAWWPTSGTVMLLGGGMTAAMRDVFTRRLIDLAGGPDAQIVMIPTANPRADSTALRLSFEQRDAHHVTIMNTLDKETANSQEFVKPLRSANAVFMTGGESTVLETAYLGTLVEHEIKAVLERGGVVAGDSAGAIAIGCAWLTWLPDPFGKRGEEFCILPRVAVNPHANRARGYVVDDEVMTYLTAHPAMIGLDIDESTILILRGSAAEVIGDGSVSILDVSKSKTAPYLKLSGGQKIDLRN
jgi:cyanophycinase